jgi:hypothetical protein
MVDASMALLVPSVETAMFTEFIVTEVAHVLFENFTRSVSPPIETRTICRNVLLAKYGEGGVLPDATAYGAQLQVPTHFFVESEFGSPKRLPELNTMLNASITEIE